MQPADLKSNRKYEWNKSKSFEIVCRELRKHDRLPSI